jgi:hypothetical protein
LDLWITWLGTIYLKSKDSSTQRGSTDYDFEDGRRGHKPHSADSFYKLQKERVFPGTTMLTLQFESNENSAGLLTGLHNNRYALFEATKFAAILQKQ